MLCCSASVQYVRHKAKFARGQFGRAFHASCGVEKKDADNIREAQTPDHGAPCRMICTYTSQPLWGVEAMPFSTKVVDIDRRWSLQVPPSTQRVYGIGFSMQINILFCYRRLGDKQPQDLRLLADWMRLKWWLGGLMAAVNQKRIAGLIGLAIDYCILKESLLDVSSETRHLSRSCQTYYTNSKLFDISQTS